MMERLERLLEHYMGVRAPTRAIVWGAMSHLGDGRATDPSARGETTLGQKVKERFGGAAVSIGLTTHRGTVSAASTWAGECQTCELRPARADSFAGLLHEAKPTSLVLPLDKPQIARHFDDRYLERIIGPIYTPESERQYHYVKARLASQFDVLVHWDETHALEFRPPTSSSRDPCSRRDTSASTS